MDNESTVTLLKECNSGTQMAVYSLGEVLENVKEQKLAALLSTSKEHHEKLGNELHAYLNELGCDPKDPGVMAKGMSWMKTNAKLAVDDSDRVCAALITDGCHMGTKTIQQHMNRCYDADGRAKKLAQELIRIEEQLVDDLKPYL